MPPPKALNAPRGTVRGTSAFSAVKFVIRAMPLPAEIFKFIQENLSVIKDLERSRRNPDAKEHSDELSGDVEERLDEVLSNPTTTPENFWDSFSERCSKLTGEWAQMSDKVWAFGPQGAGGCLLIDARSNVITNS